MTGQYRLGDIRHNFADVGKLQTLLGLKPEVSLAAGLGHFAGWVNMQALPDDRLGQVNDELKRRGMLG